MSHEGCSLPTFCNAMLAPSRPPVRWILEEGSSALGFDFFCAMRVRLCGTAPPPNAKPKLYQRRGRIADDHYASR